MTITLRREQGGDEPAIYSLTKAAFFGLPFSDGKEHELLDRLRNDGDLAHSLVAMDSDQTIIGHIAFSKVVISSGPDNGPDNWYGLGPVSVFPPRQHTGIGAALIQRGLSDLKSMGANGCVLLGNPVYYRRFGFIHDPKLRYPGPPPEYFQRIVFHGPSPTGTVTYAPAFG